MTKTFARMSVLSLLFAALATPAAAESFKIVGAGGPQGVLRDAAAAFSKANPGVTVEIPDSVGTGGGFKGVGEGEAAMGRVGRPAKGKEVEYGLDYLVFARSPAVFFAHPGVTVKGLTSAQTVALFAGSVTNWSQVGGPDLKVRVVTRQAGEANLDVMKKVFPGWKDLAITERSKLVNTDQEMSAAVAENAGAIGFGPLNEGRDKKLTVLAIDGVAATDAAYPAQSEFALVFRKSKQTPGMKAFVDFLFSAEGQQIVRANAATPVARN